MGFCPETGLQAQKGLTGCLNPVLGEQEAGMESNGEGDEGRPFFCPILEEHHSFAILLPP